jgi:hypothetical protein
MPLIDINKFRNAEILDENIRDYEGSNELARKLIMTYANDNAKSNAVLPSPSQQALLDKYLTGFLNSVVFTYGLINKGQEFNTDELITRWNNLTTYFVNNINPLYNYYVASKLDNDITTRVKDIYDQNLSLYADYGDVDYGLNTNALDTLYSYVKNGVLRPIPHAIINNEDELTSERLEKLNAKLEDRYADSSEDEDGDIPPLLPVAPVAPVAPVEDGSSSENEELEGLLASGKRKKVVRGKGLVNNKAIKDASLGKTPSGYTTSQASPNRDSVKTVKSHYYGKGLPKLIRF